MKTCLWCNTPLENGEFCVGGGITISPNSTTGEGFAYTKSYCYNDFLTILKLIKELELDFTSDQLYYLTIKRQVKEWYKGI